MFSHRMSGTCSSSVSFELRDGVVHGVSFVGGCRGNLQGIAALVEGMPASDVIARLRGIRCGAKPTSCPDQFARALQARLSAELLLVADPAAVAGN